MFPGIRDLVFSAGSDKIRDEKKYQFSTVEGGTGAGLLFWSNVELSAALPLDELLEESLLSTVESGSGSAGRRRK